MVASPSFLRTCFHFLGSPPPYYLILLRGFRPVEQRREPLPLPRCPAIRRLDSVCVCDISLKLSRRPHATVYTPEWNKFLHPEPLCLFGISLPVALLLTANETTHCASNRLASNRLVSLNNVLWTSARPCQSTQVQRCTISSIKDKGKLRPYPRMELRLFFLTLIQHIMSMSQWLTQCALTYTHIYSVGRSTVERTDPFFLLLEHLHCSLGSTAAPCSRQAGPL